MSLEFVHAGTYTVMHHQYYQMVDILMQYCKKSMGGLNPHALPYAPATKQDVGKSNTHDMRNKKSNAKSSTWHACEKKKGRKYANKNKNKIVKETKGVANRFSRLQEMVKDNNELVEAIEKVVEEDKLRDTSKNENKNETKDDKTTNKDATSYDVDKIDESALDDIIQSFATNDRHGNEEGAHNATSNVCSNNNVEGVQIHADWDFNRSNEGSEHDSEKEREMHYAMHPDSESECADFDSISERDIDEWMQRKEERWKHKIKSHSD